MSMPPPGDEPPPALPFLISVVSGLLTTMLPAVLFTAQLEGRQLTWGPVLLLMARKAGAAGRRTRSPAIFIAWSAEAVMLRGRHATRSATARSLIPAQHRRRRGHLRLDPGALQLPALPRDPARARQAAAGAVAVAARRSARAVFWPLTASSRLTEGNRWRLVFYTLLGQALPVGGHARAARRWCCRRRSSR